MSELLRNLSTDLVDAIWRAPASVVKIPRRTLIYLLVYIFSSSIVLGAVAFAVTFYQDELQNLLLEFLFPKSWHVAVKLLIDRFFYQQHKIILSNAIITLSLNLVMLFLFPIKELVSKSFEVRRRLLPVPVEEFALWFQAWEEIKYFLLFVAVQLSIFWIGYHPDAFRTNLAIVLGYLFLFLSFAVDFLSPIFQRHRGRYSRIIKTLLRRPLMSLAFGCWFSLPAVLVGFLWRVNSEWSLGKAIVLMYCANILAMAWASVAGTWLGAKLYPFFEKSRDSSLPVRWFAWILVVCVLAWNGFAYVSVGLSIHHKSQLFKCQYTLVPESFGIDRPNLLALLNKRVTTGVHGTVRIKNPTPYDVSIEDNRIEVLHEDDLVANTRLTPVNIPAGTEIDQPIDFSLVVNLEMLKKGTDLLHGEKWKMILYLEIAPDFEFPIYLYTP